MRPALALLLAALPLVAGCAAPDPSADAPDADATRDDAAASVLRWTLTDCRYLVGWSPADPAKLQARLPDGFRVGDGTLLGVADSPTTSLGTEAFECASGSGLDGDVAGMTYGSLWFPVAPPDELRVDGVELYYWKEDVLVPDGPRRARLASAGLPVLDGAVAWPVSPAPDGVRATLTLDGVGDFGLALDLPQASPAPDGGEFVEFTPDGAGGVAAWRATYAWTDGTPFANGRGLIDWPAGSWAADAVGATRAPGQFHAGTWSFSGTLALPARASG